MAIRKTVVGPGFGRVKREEFADIHKEVGK
jgi:hypothetical protein